MTEMIEGICNGGPLHGTWRRDGFVVDRDTFGVYRWRKDWRCWTWDPTEDADTPDVPVAVVD